MLFTAELCLAGDGVVSDEIVQIVPIVVADPGIKHTVAYTAKRNLG